jgi:glycerol-3-phosphate O-acyltransferase / dihydroxyacetone phosphate acyltransferase
LFYRLGKLALLSIAVLPGLVLFAPVFIAGKVISIQKSKEALAASTVKIKARDVVATWKLLVSMALAPALLTFDACVITWWAHHNRVQGFVPEWVPIWAVGIFSIFLLPSICYASLRFGEIGMDIVKSLRPILISLSPTSGNALVKLRERRRNLATEVTELINTLGPELFPDFDSARIVADPFRDESVPSSRFNHQRTPSERSAFSGDSIFSSPISPTKESTGADGLLSLGGVPSGQSHLPRNESFKNLGNIGLFASHPHTPRSRSRTSSSGGLAGSAGFPIQAFSTLDSKEGFEEVSKKIRGAMRERGQRRKSRDGGWGIGGDDDDDGTMTPVSEYGKKDN